MSWVPPPVSAIRSGSGGGAAGHGAAPAERQHEAATSESAQFRTDGGTR